MDANTPTILLVDDDADICENMADILSDRGFRVDVAHDGSSALELVKSAPYAVALLDLKMPGMDGLTLCGEIRKIRPRTIAILITAYLADAAANRAQESGIWKVMTKPIDLPRILGCIDEAVGGPAGSSIA